jgi:hypothetical protein
MPARRWLPLTNVARQGVHGQFPQAKENQVERQQHSGWACQIRCHSAR